MDEIILSQYAHRVGYTLSNVFEDDKIGFRCLECSGFICPETTERTVRQISLTTNLRLQSVATQLNMSQTIGPFSYKL